MLVAACAQGSVSYTETYTPNTYIPNGNPVGIAFTENISEPGGTTYARYVSDLTVTLNISGGYNGGLVAYLVAPNGTYVSLLNQPGVTGGNPFGYGGSGLNITLADGNRSIQSTYETPGVSFGSGGTYGADGLLSSVYGSALDGNWTLFFANLSSGGANGELTSFTLNFTAVPEPVGIALGIFAGLAALSACLGMCWKKKLPKHATVHGN